MNLATGTRLGVYEIVAPIGAGGMGEVYRAKDTRLDRTVALKILPPRYAAGEMRERFEREARVVSSLNHPNICTLYDVGQQNDVSFLVMEYIEGQSLADKISRGPLPLDQALRYAVDIAEALAKAHAHGIVHRDLKPGNVMITKGGAKLLDFGLARRADDKLVSQDAPTIQGGAPLTAKGTILGTLHYMSPEQLEGHAIDARSDLFAFGAVLYEMVTGRRAFEATSHASLITKIMSEQPRSVRELQPITPRALERIIARCLQKEPEHRWQCAGDLAAELRAIGGDVGAEQVAAAPRRAIVPWALAALFAIVAIALGALLLRKPRAESATVRFTIPAPAGTTLTMSVLSSPLAVSPDGRSIAFVAISGGERHIWIRGVGERDAKRLESTGDAIAPFWSPDGTSIGFFSGSALKAVDVARDSARAICDIPPGASGAGTWSGDGTIVYALLAAGDGLYVVPAAGGKPRLLPRIDGMQAYHFPRFLSDEKRFLFTGIDEMTTTSLWVSSLDGSMRRRIARDVARVDLVPPHLIYVRDGTLVAQRFDEDKLQFAGEPIVIAPGVYTFKPLGQSPHSATARTIAWLPFPPTARMVWLDRRGNEMEDAAKPDDYVAARISPDGKRIVTDILDRATGMGNLAVIDRFRKTSTRVSFENQNYSNPSWAPDGKRILYSIDLEGPAHLFTKVVGSDKDEKLTPPGNIQAPTHWAGDRIFYSENAGATRSDILTLSPADRRVSVWLQTRFNEWEPRVSPDGRWVAFLSDQSGRTELYAAPIDRPTEAVRVSANGASRRGPRWSNDGSELYFLNGRDLMAAQIKASAGSIDVAEPVRLFSAQSDVKSFDVDNTGKFLFTLDPGAAMRGVSVLVDWQGELEKQLAKK